MLLLVKSTQISPIQNNGITLVRYFERHAHMVSQIRPVITILQKYWTDDVHVSYDSSYQTWNFLSDSFDILSNLKLDNKMSSFI